MLSNFSWEAFRKTGDINAYCLYKDVERITTNVELGTSDVISDDKRDSNRLQ